MKSLLIFIFVFCVAIQTQAQDSRWKFDVETTLGFSQATSPIRNVNTRTFMPSYNAFVRSSYQFSSIWSAGAGLGYFQVREYERLDCVCENDIAGDRSLKTHHYLLAPLGFTYRLKPFFLRPEIGIGVNLSNTYIHEKYWLTDPERVVYSTGKENDATNTDSVNTMTYPLLLSIGTEIPASMFSMVLALQGYFTLNPIGQAITNQRHAYGFGATLGLKI